METTDITGIIPDKPTKPKGIPIERLLELKDKNLSRADMATILGCSKTNVTNRLAGYKSTIKGIDTFKKHKADVLAHLQMETINHITSDKQKDSSATQLVTQLAILIDKERLLRGESSVNMSVATLIETHTANLDGLTGDIAKLTQELDSE